MKSCVLCKKELSPNNYEYDDQNRVDMIDYFCTDCNLKQSIYIKEKDRTSSEVFIQGELWPT